MRCAPIDERFHALDRGYRCHRGGVRVAAVVLWLLERVSSVPPQRRHGPEVQPSATDAAIILGGVLVGASSLLEPAAMPYLIPMALALIAMGAVPYQRSAAQRSWMRLLALLLFCSVHVMFFATSR
jgi:hypothetical protein